MIWAVDEDGADIRKWSAWDCLFGDLSFEGETYVLDDGDFYLVAQEFLASLDTEVEAIDEWSTELIPWPKLDHEDSYNEAVVMSSSDFLLLDRRTVRVSAHTSQIEVCDVLTSDRSLVHVKRKRDGSASLSHLFAQGLVSAELAVSSPEFRSAASTRIQEAEQNRAQATGDESFLGRFGVFDGDAVAASSLEVVYAIGADWSAGGLETLPFFSKITLRNTIDELTGRGFRVAVKRIAMS